ncbi:peroxiredoxin [Pseudomonas sp. WHRI 8519]|uniref:peroxiredoxin n=1 Tax=Pseudomonas sp. WHRI 8519 TaxID=3162567 RepID=UPI0032F07595
MAYYRTEAELQKSLIGQKLPNIPFVSTSGSIVDLAKLTGLTVLFIYPRTGNPAIPAPAELEAIPGAKGCTPQACGFRDHLDELSALGVSHIYGLSSQDSSYQSELKSRQSLNYELLSDEACRLASSLKLPTFQAGELLLYSRAALIIKDGVLLQIFTEIPNPGENASTVATWLKDNLPS